MDQELLAPRLGGQSAETCYDMYLAGSSYGEIADRTGLNLFEVMREVAGSAKLYAKFRRANPHVEYEYLVTQLRRVIAQGWDDHGEDCDGKGKLRDSLPAITSAAKTLAGVLPKIAELADIDQVSATELPEGISGESLRRLAREAVRQKFPIRATPLRSV